MEDNIKGRLPQWKMTSDQASQAGTELGPLFYTITTTKQILKLWYVTTMSKQGQLI